MTDKELEKMFNILYGYYDFEEVLEFFDVTPQEAFEVLFTSGLISEETLRDLTAMRMESDDD